MAKLAYILVALALGAASVQVSNRIACYSFRQIQPWIQGSGVSVTGSSGDRCCSSRISSFPNNHLA